MARTLEEEEEEEDDAVMGMSPDGHVALQPPPPQPQPSTASGAARSMDSGGGSVPAFRNPAWTASGLIHLE
jgi:hypothetical protein